MPGLLSHFPSETVRVVKPDGSRHEVHGSVQPTLLVTEDVSPPIDEGDIVERDLPNGKVEVYEVLEANFYQRSPILGEHYQCKIRKTAAVRNLTAPQATVTMIPVNAPAKFHVALSFAGEQREYAKQLRDALTRRGFMVFYDDDFSADLWGSNLVDHLARVYGEESDYVMILVSHDYVRKEFTDHERQNAQARALKQKGEAYILPIQVDSNARLPGMPSTISYLSADKGVDAIADIFQLKWNKRVTPSPAATPAPAPAAPATPAEPIFNNSREPWVIWPMPRGYILIEGIAMPTSSSPITANYFHFGEGWRAGTHFHPSYGREWGRRSQDQAYKLGVPKADFSYARDAIDIVIKIGILRSRGESTEQVVSKVVTEFPSARALKPNEQLSIHDLPSSDEVSPHHEIRDFIHDIQEAIDAKGPHGDTLAQIRREIVRYAQARFAKDESEYLFLQEIVKDGLTSDKLANLRNLLVDWL